MKKALLIAAIAFTACNKDDKKSDAADTASAPTGNEVNPNDVTTVGIQEGELQGTNADVPPGALPEGAKVALEPADTPEEFSALELTSAALNMTATAKDGTPIYELTYAVEVTLPLKAAALNLTDDKEPCALLKSQDEKWVWKGSLIEVADGKAKFKSQKLGTFQLASCGANDAADFKDALAITKTPTCTDRPITAPTDEASCTTAGGSWEDAGSGSKTSSGSSKLLLGDMSGQKRCISPYPTDTKDKCLQYCFWTWEHAVADPSTGSSLPSYCTDHPTASGCTASTSSNLDYWYCRSPIAASVGSSGTTSNAPTSDGASSAGTSDGPSSGTSSGAGLK